MEMFITIDTQNFTTRMSQSIEEVADTYQTYRVLSDDGDFEFPVTEIFHSTSRLFLGLEADGATFYIRILPQQNCPNKQFATLEDIFGEHEFTPESIIGTKVTVHIDESLENATLKGDAFSADFPVTQDHPTTTHNANEYTSVEDTPSYWDEFAQNCATSYWYHTAEEHGEHGRKTQIDEVKEVSDESVLFTIEADRARPTVNLPIPKNADTENNQSAEFIEDCAGGIQLLEGASVIAVPRNQGVDSQVKGFLTEFEDFAIYSPSQYTSYIENYTPSSTSRKSNSVSTSPRHSKNGARLMRVGFALCSQFAIFELFMAHTFEKILTSSTPTSTQTGTFVLSFMMNSVQLFAVVGLLSFIGGLFIYSQEN